jgi:chromosome segregation ATPase
MSRELIERLATAGEKLRRTPMPIADLIPMIQASKDALEQQAAELHALKRWRSTNAPRLEALEGLLHTAQHELHGAREAVATLASEREANAILTAEVEALRKDAERLDSRTILIVGRAMFNQPIEMHLHDIDLRAAIDAAMSAPTTEERDATTRPETPAA